MLRKSPTRSPKIDQILQTWSKNLSKVSGHSKTGLRFPIAAKLAEFVTDKVRKWIKVMMILRYLARHGPPNMSEFLKLCTQIYLPWVSQKWSQNCSSLKTFGVISSQSEKMVKNDNTYLKYCSTVTPRYERIFLSLPALIWGCNGKFKTGFRKTIPSKLTKWQIVKVKSEGHFCLSWFEWHKE